MENPVKSILGKEPKPSKVRKLVQGVAKGKPTGDTNKIVDNIIKK